MLLLEKKTYNIDIDESSDILITRLKENIHKSTFGEDYNTNQKQFEGSVKQDFFIVMRNTKYRKSYIPILKGKISKKSYGTNVKLTIYAQPFTVVFYLIWMTMGIGFIFMFIFSSISNSMAFIPIPILIIMIVAANITLNTNYNKEFLKSKNLIIDIIRNENNF